MSDRFNIVRCWVLSFLVGLIWIDIGSYFYYCRFVWFWVVDDLYFKVF